MSNQTEEPIENRITDILLEYAQNVPAMRPFSSSLSLRNDLAIESLSLVSLTLRLGEAFEVDLIELDLELGKLETVGDLVALGRTLKEKGRPA
jgi:acyl carrier protein